jgi:hypothetical protein
VIEVDRVRRRDRLGIRAPVRTAAVAAEICLATAVLAVVVIAVLAEAHVAVQAGEAIESATAETAEAAHSVATAVSAHRGRIPADKRPRH